MILPLMEVSMKSGEDHMGSHMSTSTKLLKGAKCSFLALGILPKYARVNNYVYHHNLVFNIDVPHGESIITQGT